MEDMEAHVKRIREKVRNADFQPKLLIDKGGIKSPEPGVL